MQIYVCVKHVPDSAANITIVDEKSIDESIAFLLNPYDEHAVTEAAALKKQFEGSEIIAVCLGKKDVEKTIRSAMAMGADRGIIIETGRGLNTPSYPTFPDVVKARKKQVDTIDYNSLALETPPGSIKLIELVPLTQERSPKEIKGTPGEIAARIATILKEEAKVIA